MGRQPLVKGIHIVTGAGYGDEGKGVTTKWLASRFPTRGLVVRYGGGNQVGHTVIGEDGVPHVHHHTGSGTLEGVPTFYSRFCTVDPIGVLIECDVLVMLHHIQSKLIYDPRVMIVTPLDVLYNEQQHKLHAHGTVGVGFGATIARNEANYRLCVGDIVNKDIFNAKLDQIIKYYAALGIDAVIPDTFYRTCLQFYTKVKCCTLNYYLKRSAVEELIFEGHQGVLLDMEYGVFPHVTRSKTTCKNAYTIIQEEINNYDKVYTITNYLVTRCYHTRHGNGHFISSPIKLINTEHETNVYSPWQGEFKKAPFDIKLFNFAVRCNNMDIPSTMQTYTNLIVTCADQVEDVERDKVLRTIRGNDHNFSQIFTNWSPAISMKEYI